MELSAKQIPILKCQLSLRWRILSYLLPWLGTVAAFFFLFFPESPAETSDSRSRQAMELPAGTPLMTAVGLAHSFQWSDFPGGPAVCGAVIGLLAHACIMLSRRSLASLVTLLALQILLLGTGVAGFLHLSNLPAGG
jgi:hypothetical protein